jgi:hypothetical protein
MSLRRTAPLLVFVFAVQIGLPRNASAQSATDIVIEWNRILQATVAIPGALPPTIFITRPLAILHVAMFDALNSIDYVYQPYAVRATVVGSPSREVAAARAARDVMVAMFPAQAATFDAALAATVARFPGDPGTQGANIGAAAAQAILALRANDGWVRAAQVPYILPDLPGYWQPVPPQNATATLVHYQDVLPFALGSRMQFMVEAPPALTSQRYADDFNEVKRLGGATSTERTAQQTQTAQLWAGVGYSPNGPLVWFNLGSNLARARALNGVDTARNLALLAITMHDALLTSFSSKFLYGLWRPTTAIRAADRDNNPATEADPTFVSLIPTPPYPSYAGNMACVGASSSALFARIFGRDDVPFSVTWTGIAQPDVTRSYNGFRQAADEEARSRIYAGIHYTFDHTASFGSCTNVANYTFSNYLIPK